MNRAIALVLGIVGAVVLFLGGVAVGDAFTDRTPRTGPTAVLPVVGEGSPTGTAALPVVPPVHTSSDPALPDDLPATGGTPPVGYEEVAISADVAAIGAAATGDDADSAPTDPEPANPPDQLERVRPVFVDPSTDDVLREIADATADRTDDDFRVTVDDIVGPVVDRDELQRSFTDRCVADPAGCPFGVPAVVLGPLESGAVPLAAHLTVPPADTGQRCDFGDHQPFDLPLLVTTTHPAALTITYSLPSDGMGPAVSATVTTELPTGTEVDLWQERLDADTIGDTWPDGWLNQCVVLPALTQDRALYSVELTARASTGEVASRTANLMPPAFSDRDLPSIMARNDTRLSIVIPVGDDESAFVWPIEVAAFPELDCPAVESSHLTGRREPDQQHPDPLIDEALWRAGNNPVTDDDGDRASVFTLPYREGRRYLVCGWVYRKAGSRSFDTLEIVERYQYEVHTPNRHPVVVTLVEAQVAGIGSDSVTMRPWLSGCPERVAAPRFRIDGPGVYPLGIVLCDSDGGEIARTLALGGIFSAGDQQVFGAFAGIPIDTRSGCDLGRDEIGCALRSRMDLFHFFTPITPGCDDCHIDGVVTVRVDYPASRGEGAGSWIVALDGTFPAAPDPGPGPPQVDTRSLVMAPIYDGVGERLRIEFDTNRPTDATLALRPMTNAHVCDPVTVPTWSTTAQHATTVTGLCSDTAYTLDIALTDEEGRTASYDGTGRWYASTRSQQLAGLAVILTHVGTDEAAAAARCAEVSEAVERFQGDPLDPTCWTTVAHGWNGEGAFFHVDGGGSSFTRTGNCAVGEASETLGGSLEYVPGRVHQVTVNVTLHLSPECGGPTPLSGVSQTTRESEQTVEKALSRYGRLLGRYPVHTGDWEPGQRVVLGTLEMGGLEFLVEGVLTPIQQDPFG